MSGSGLNIPVFIKCFDPLHVTLVDINENAIKEFRNSNPEILYEAYA